MILAIDTSTRMISLALAAEHSLLAEATWRSADNHTIELAPGVDRLLRAVGLSVEQLTAVAVAVGPGSFTGVRIGLGLAKGLALARGLPAIGVRTLDIAVRAVPPSGPTVIAVVPAGRGRVVWARYAAGPRGWESGQASLVGDWHQLIEWLSPEEMVIGEIDPAGLELLRQRQIRIGTPAQNVRRAAHLAEIGWERWRQARLDEAATLTPIYAQRPTSGEGAVH